MNNKKSILLLSLLILLQSTPMVLAQQQGSSTLPPLFDHESRQDFNPDTNPMLKPAIDLKVPQELYKVKNLYSNEQKENKPKETTLPEVKNIEKSTAQPDKEVAKYKPENLKFQIANPKDVYLPEVKIEKPAVTTKPEVAKTEEKPKTEDIKPKIEVAKTEEKPKTEDNKPKTFQEDSKISAEQPKTTNKENAKPTPEKLSITPKSENKEEPKTEKKPPDKTSEISINNLIKQPEVIKMVPPTPESDNKSNIEESNKVSEAPANQAQAPENTKIENSTPALTPDNKIPEITTTATPVKEDTKKPEQDSNIDFYLKKYESTMQAQANVNEFKYSLLEPFKQSLFYKVLTDNKYENIEFQTQDVTAESQPEGIVSYNIPLGAEGEYACQIMVLKPDGADLTKMWVSEQIPGEMDSVMVQDVNNDGQNDIVAVSTTGGVSLLKSIRVYSYDRSKITFQTIFAMNGIMEGIVNVKPGKILISETFPGGINRAALYVWNGKRFERLEL